MEVATFRASVINKRELMSVLFANVQHATLKYVALRDEIRTWTQSVWLDFPHSEQLRSTVAERDGWNATLQDSAAAIVLIAAASIERLYKAINVSLFDRGIVSYAEHIYFSRALWILSVQYKHLGEWKLVKKLPSERAELEALVGDPLRPDAAAEFLRRSAFTSYQEFENALLSCSDAITEPFLVPSGDGGVPTVMLRGFSTPADDADAAQRIDPNG